MVKHTISASSMVQIVRSGRCRSKIISIVKSFINRWRKNMRQQVRLILSKNVVHNNVKEMSTKGLIKVQSDMYEKLSVKNKIFLMKKLLQFKMEDGSPVAAHVNKFITNVNQLSYVKTEFNDEVCALILPWHLWQIVKRP